MATYIKNGKRQVKVSKDKLVKKHTKGFYKTLNKINELADYFINNKIEVTEDNVEELAKEQLRRDIDSMEKFLLLGRLYTDEIKDNIK